MNFVSSVLTYARRYLKTPSPEVLSDELLIDYFNRAVLEVDLRYQLFDFKTTYSFFTTPGVDRYNMPLYSQQQQPGNQLVGKYPIYQGFFGPAFVDGFATPFYTQKGVFDGLFPNFLQRREQVATGDGGTTYSFTIPGVVNASSTNPPVSSLIRGHIDVAGLFNLTGNEDPPTTDSAGAQTLIPQILNTSVHPAIIIATQDLNNQNLIVTDSGIFLQSNANYGLLISSLKPPYTNQSLGVYSTTENTVNYLSGEINVEFPSAVPAGARIDCLFYYYQAGLPRAILYENNTITLRAPPADRHKVEMQAYLTPAVYLSTGNTLQFGYMAEYLALLTASKVLYDTGDIEQLQLYEPKLREQELLIVKRSERQKTATRTPNMFAPEYVPGGIANNFYGGYTI